MTSRHSYTGSSANLLPATCGKNGRVTHFSQPRLSMTPTSDLWIKATKAGRIGRISTESLRA